jgi:hypothetical protein
MKRVPGRSPKPPGERVVPADFILGNFKGYNFYIFPVLYRNCPLFELLKKSILD